MDWENGKTHSVHGTLVVNASANTELRKHLVIADAKSLYDMMKQGAGVRSKEPRVTLMAAELRQGISALGLQARWTPHNLMLCNPLTKAAHKANLQPLRTVMSSGNYQLSPEWQLEAERSQTRSEGQLAPRMRGMRRCE